MKNHRKNAKFDEKNENKSEICFLLFFNKSEIQYSIAKKCWRFWLKFWVWRTVQRSASCRSRRELSDLSKFSFFIFPCPFFLIFFSKQIAIPTSIYLQKSASIQPRMSLSKFGGKFNSFFIRLISHDVQQASFLPRTMEGPYGLLPVPNSCYAKIRS